MTEKTTKAVIDWERIEADYRAGMKSVREIAAENAVTHPAIMKRAKRDGWDRDLSARIQAKADALVTKQMVTAEVTAAKLETERQVIEIGAQAVANVRLAHRTDIKRMRDHVARLHAELVQMEEATENKAALGVRVDLAKKIADAQKTLMVLEREAWGIQNSSEGQTPQTITKIVREIVRKT